MNGRSLDSWQLQFVLDKRMCEHLPDSDTLGRIYRQHLVEQIP